MRTDNSNLLNEIISIIKTELTENLEQIDHPSLLSGIGGPILFFSYLYKTTNDECLLNQINQGVDILLAGVEKYKIDYSFEKGMSGIAWLLQFLVNENIIDLESPDIFESFDKTIIDSIEVDIQNKRYDYFSGLIGKGVYYLERSKYNNQPHPYLTSIIQELVNLSEHDYRGTYWQDFYSVGRSIEDKNLCSLGLSHGIPSILVFLSEVLKLDLAEYEHDSISKMLENAVKWVLSYHQEKDSLIFFPSRIVNKEMIYPLDPPERLAWCHGDLGIAASLLKVNESLKETYVYDAALELAKFQISRKEDANTGIVDACLCHGTSGVSLLFKQIFNQTDIGDFKNCSQYWLQRTVGLANLSSRSSGYKTWFEGNDGKGVWKTDFGLLNGISGIGLVLIDNLPQRSQLFNWEKVLLI